MTPALEEPGEAGGPQLACDLPIDRPGAIAHNQLTLSGWAVSKVGISGVIVQIDGRLLHAAYGLETSWVAESMEDMPGAGHAGYRLELDTSNWAPGPREITITAYDQQGRRGDITGQVDLIPFAAPRHSKEANLAAIAAGEVAMSVDSPSLTDAAPEIESPVEITGWAHAAAGLDAVIVTIDGGLRQDALYPIVRPDLIDDYGEEVAANGGFTLTLHPRECPPGWHRLSVLAIDRERRAVGVERDFLCLPEPPPNPSTEAIDWIADPRARPRTLDRHEAGAHAGTLLEAERQLRYRLVAPLAEGRDVLDAGCGSGWGAALMAKAGARRVIGFDDSEEALDAAGHATADQAVELARGDLTALPFDDGSFDLITCFEAIEQVEEPDAALDELRRVLRADGVLLMTATRPLPGTRARAPVDLERRLRERFAHVSVRRQQTLLGSALIDDRTLAVDDGGESEVEIAVRKLGQIRPGGERHTLAVAGDGPLPELPPTLLLASSGAVRRLRDTLRMWQDRALLAEADGAASRNQANLAKMHQEGTLERLRQAEAEIVALKPRLETANGELASVRGSLEEAERAGQHVVALERQLEELDGELRSARAAAEDAERRVALAEELAASREASISWRVTLPLRAVKRAALRLRRPAKTSG